MRRLPPSLTVLVAALLLTVAGCADDAEPTAGPTSAPTAAPTTSETDTTPPPTEPTGTETPEPEPTETETAEPTEPAEPTASETVEPTATTTPEPAEPPVDLDAPPTTYDEALAHFEARGQEPQAVRRFETSDGTYCRLGGSTLVSCELPPPGIPDPDYCGEGPAQNVGRAALLRTGPRAECNSDTIREGAPTPLDVGSVGGSSAGVLCLVEEIGVTCIDPERTQGFYLGGTEYRVFAE